MMDKLKFYRYAATGLLVLNLAILAFFFLYRPMVGGPMGPPQATHGELKFDEEQLKAFHGLVEIHQVEMQRINRQQKELLADYFNTLSESQSDSLVVVPKGYSSLEEEKINGTYEHFLQVKALLRPEQQQDFPAFVDRTLKNILGQGRKQPPKRRKRNR